MAQTHWTPLSTVRGSGKPTLLMDTNAAAPARLYINRKDVGEFMKKKVFVQAATLPWHEFIESATGEKLSPKAFAQDFITGDLK